MAKLEDLSFPFHAEGFPYMGGMVLIMVVLSLFKWPFMFVGGIVTIWCFYFFRDPERVTPTRSGLIVSPADGKVVAVQEVEPDETLGLGDKTPRTRVSIFLNIFDVHVNRIPTDSTVVSANYRKGKFINAARDKASVDNERMALILQLAGDHPLAGAKMACVQIAGLIARRIVCTAEEGEDMSAGERYGIIRFGSRVDIYLPAGLNSLVTVGQYMLGGETVLADCTSKEATRHGESRP